MSSETPIRFTYDVMGRFLLHRGDEPPMGVRPVRLFPLSQPDGYIALLDHDEKEMALIRDLGEIDLPSRQALLTELEASYLVPQVRRVESIEEEFGVLHWVVQTDRGERRFDVRGRDEIQLVTPDHYVIRDIDGNRFEISSLLTLDSRSLAILDAYL